MIVKNLCLPAGKLLPSGELIDILQNAQERIDFLKREIILKYDTNSHELRSS